MGNLGKIRDFLDDRICFFFLGGSSGVERELLVVAFLGILFLFWEFSFSFYIIC